MLTRIVYDRRRPLGVLWSCRSIRVRFLSAHCTFTDMFPGFGPRPWSVLDIGEGEISVCLLTIRVGHQYLSSWARVWRLANVSRKGGCLQDGAPHTPANFEEDENSSSRRYAWIPILLVLFADGLHRGCSDAYRFLEQHYACSSNTRLQPYHGCVITPKVGRRSATPYHSPRFEVVPFPDAGRTLTTTPHAYSHQH